MTRNLNFETFKAQRRAALEASVPDASGIGTYLSAAGYLIRYQVNDAGSYILERNGAPRPNFATRGAVINAEGDGKAVISSPWSAAKVIIDYSDWAHPLRGEVP